MLKLKEVRLEKGLTQKQLAEKAGVNIRVLQHYEQGSKCFDHAKIDTIYKLAIALECGISEILENDEYIAIIKQYENGTL